MATFTDQFRAMNTDVDVAIEAETPPAGAFASIRLVFEQQEERFSRFRPGSLLSRLNRGEEITDAWLARACAMALDCHDTTGGLFNPMVLAALEDAGYDRTFDEVHSGKPMAQPVPGPHACLLIRGETVAMRGGRLDLGGLVKGWTVDLAVEMTDEFAGVLVNAGGDMRATGGEAGLAGWEADIEHPSGETLWRGRLVGALATSTTLRRRWAGEGGTPAHHVIDPRTGLPSSGALVQVSAWAGEAWRAEAWAKAVLIGGREVARAAATAGVRVLMVGADGEVTQFDPA